MSRNHDVLEGCAEHKADGPKLNWLEVAASMGSRRLLAGSDNQSSLEQLGFPAAADILPNSNQPPYWNDNGSWDSDTRRELARRPAKEREEINHFADLVLSGKKEAAAAYMQSHPELAADAALINGVLLHKQHPNQKTVAGPDKNDITLGVHAEVQQHNCHERLIYTVRFETGRKPDNHGFHVQPPWEGGSSC